MKSSVFYKVLIGLLLILNIATLSYLLLQSNHEPHHPPKSRWNHIDHIIIDRLHLNEQQQNEFEQLKNDHHAHILQLQADAAQLHKNLFLLLQSETLDITAKDSIMSLIESNDHRKEQITFEHFQRLRKILRPEQKKDFDGFVEELGHTLLSHPPEKQRP